jgi:tyrosinase
MPTTPKLDSPPEMVAASEQAFTLAGGSTSVGLTVPQVARARVASATTSGSRILLSVDDIKADANPGVVYGVYLDLPPGANVDQRREYHVGNVALFGIEKMNDPDVRQNCPPGFPHLFDATRVVNKLTEEGRWDPSAVTVTFQPIEPLPPPGQEDTWQAESAAPDVPPVEVGRVGLFVA